MSKKISEIVLRDFRGYKGSKTIEIGDSDLVVFLGLNGFGKSTIFDAVEWCFTGKIGRYEKFNDVGRKIDFGKEKELLRNKYVLNPNTSVEVKLSDNSEFGRKVIAGPSENDYGPGVPIPGKKFGIEDLLKEKLSIEEINSYFTATHVLSQETINHFVTSKKPDERYNALSVNFGTSQYLPFESNCALLLKKIKERIKQNRKEIKDLELLIEEMSKNISHKKQNIEEELKIFNQATLLLPINPEYKKIQFDTLKDVSSLGIIQKILLELKTSIDSNFIKFNRQVEVGEFLISGYENYQGIDLKLEVEEKKLTSLKLKIEEISKLKTRKKNIEIEYERVKSLKNTKEELFERIEKVMTERDKTSSLLEEVHKNKTKITQDEYKIEVLKKELDKKRELKEEFEKQTKFISTQLKLLSSSIEMIEEQRWISNSYFEQKKIVTENLNSFDETLRNLSVRKNNLNLYIERSKQGFDHFLSFFEGMTTSEIADLPFSLDQKFFTKIIDIKTIKTEIASAETELKSIIARLTVEYEHQGRLIQVLNISLEEVNHSDGHVECPVCDSKFSKQQLVESIEKKLNNFVTTQVSLLESSKSRIQSRINVLALDQASIEIELKQSYDLLVHDLYSKLGEIDKLILRNESSKEMAGREVSRLEKLKTKLDQDLKQLNFPFEDQNLYESLKSQFSRVRDQLNSTNLSNEKNIKEVSEKNQFLNQLEQEILKDKLTLKEMLASYELNSLRQVLKDSLGHDFEGLSAEEVFSELSKSRNKLYAEKENLSIKSIDTLENLSAIDDTFKKLTLDTNETDLNLQIGASVSLVESLRANLVLIQERLSILNIDFSKYRKDFLEDLLRKNIQLISENRILFENTALAQQYVRSFIEFNKNAPTVDRIKHYESQMSKLVDIESRLEKMKELVETTKRSIPEILEAHIKKNLDVSLFNSIYGSLNPHRRFKNIDFEVKTSHGKVGINFKASHGKIVGTPEYMFSSAQLNTFGVSMFLSMALRQNWLDFDSVLLDDPIQNLDDINVLSFIDLMRSLLDRKDNKQVIISTHDERFYNLLIKKFKNYKLKAFRFTSYGEVESVVL